MATATRSVKFLLQNAVLFTALLQCMAVDNLMVAYEWKVLDFAYANDSQRQAAINSGKFIPENNMPVGLEVYEDKLFITIPRWKEGVPASLAYVSLKDKSNKSPKLIPYPNWAAHQTQQDHHKTNNDSGHTPTPTLVSPFRIRADACGRLWIIDCGISDIMGNFTALIDPQIVVYDLKNNNALLRHYTIPKDHFREGSMFATIAVEDAVCDDTYAYVADILNAGLVVYSWKTEKSWKITHHYFNPDPFSGDFNVNKINFQWNDAIFGLALQYNKTDSYSTLYFHPLASTNEFTVSTRILRNKTLADMSFKDFKRLGDRGPNAQAGAAFVDDADEVLFYGLVNLNAVACWRTSNKVYDMKSQGRIYMNAETMVFPNDLKVDKEGNLWVLSDKLPVFMYSNLNYSEVNFRILTGHVKEAITGTACGMPIPTTSTSTSTTTTTTTIRPPHSKGSSSAIIPSVLFVIIQSTVFISKFLLY